MKRFFSLGIILTFLFCLQVKGQDFKPDMGSFSLPLFDWGLSIDLNNFDIKKNYIAPDGSNRNTLVEDKNSGLTVSVYIEKAKYPGNHIKCREYYWGRSSLLPFPKEDVKLYEKSDIAFVEFVSKDSIDKTVNYHSLNAFLSKDGFWIDVHISKNSYLEGDDEIFAELVKTIKIDEPKLRNTTDLFLFGSMAFQTKKFNETIKFYETILESETENINLNNRCLVHNS